ncbi:hypothetical protein EDB85DRAFT_2160859 [Lactarius pseudohatsudake]|nr:hypothetical protein EDB85DRAFT_2160859 [Lactarius pseudohatsudake]
MTATPVQTRPSDLWHIGKVIGLSGFKDDSRTNEELDDMKRSLARAKRDDKNLLLERQAESRQALHRMFEGNDDDQGLISAVNNAVDQNFRKENAKWMAVAISGLEPYEEHICLLKLYEHEYDALEALATKALDNPSFPRQFSSENFYLSVRQCLFHPVFAIKNLYEDPNLLNTYEGYRTIPSCKLNTLVEIVHHHLSVDNAPGIEPSRHCPPEAFLTPPVTPASSPPGSPVLGSQEGIAPEHGGVSRTASMPDKIIVYCYFLPRSNLSRCKGFIQEAFMNIGGSLRKALEQGDSDETLLDDDSGANEGGTAGSPVASTSKRKGKASKEKSKGKESDIRAPRARPKSRKQAASGGPSDVEATGTGQTAGAAAARPLVGAEDDGASEGLRRMTLDSERTPNEEAGPDYEFSSQSSRPTSAPRMRSITPSAGSSASMQSKRSREVSEDEGSEVSSQKRPKGDRAIGPKAVHLRRGRSGRSTPAQDEQFLTAQGHSSRPASGSRHRDLGGGEKGGKGQSRAP